MSDYNIIHSRGDPLSGPPLSVYLYPNNSAQDDDASAIADYLKTALDQIFYDSIDYYDISIYNGYLNLRGDTKDHFWTDFTDWYSTTTTNHSSTTTYSDYAGCHMGIAGGFNGGRAHGCDGDNRTAYNRGAAAVTGVLNSVKEFYGNIAIQELFHTIIRDDLGSVNSMIVDEEHDLGIIYGDGSVSPMATSYEGDFGSEDHAHHGECSPDNAFFETYKATLSNCTVDGARYTSNAEN